MKHKAISLRMAWADSWSTKSKRNWKSQLINWFYEAIRVTYGINNKYNTNDDTLAAPVGLDAGSYLGETFIQTRSSRAEPIWH